MTQTAHEKITDSETLAEQAFHLADSSPDGQITCDEYFLFRLYNWIVKTPGLNCLFSKTKPKSASNRKRLSLLETQGFSLTGALNPNFFPKPVKIRTASGQKKADYKISKTTNNEKIVILNEYFQKNANIKGKVPAKEFYEFLNGNGEFAELAEKFFKSFKFCLTTELSFGEIMTSLFKRNSFKVDSFGPSSTKTNFPVVLQEKQISVYRNLFDKYDANKDGLISRSELREALYEKFTDETIDDMFSEYDVDKKGMLNFKEFIHLLAPKNTQIPESSLLSSSKNF